MMEPHAVLSQRLAALLGFEDGADGVLELSLSMESSQVREKDKRDSRASLIVERNGARCLFDTHHASPNFVGVDGLLVTILGKNR